MTAGYTGGLTYAIIMRCIDAVMAIPGVLLALSIAALLEEGVKMVIVALGIAMTPGYARIMCGQTMSIKENDYVLAARSLSASNFRTMFRHILPNAFPPMIVMLTIAVGMVILMEAMLSFLGIGIKEPVVAWGTMVNDGYRYLSTHPVLCFAPGAAIMFVVYAFNMVGDGLRDALDPRLRGVL
jgi:ABC-type dipeptide/oligopeptide/nickel transport system permease subunit